jgi:hypothetical protein
MRLLRKIYETQQLQEGGTETTSGGVNSHQNKQVVNRTGLRDMEQIGPKENGPVQDPKRFNRTGPKSVLYKTCF